MEALRNYWNKGKYSSLDFQQNNSEPKTDFSAFAPLGTTNLGNTFLTLTMHH